MSSNSSQDEIKKTYKKMLKDNSDVDKHDTNEIEEAFFILSDENTRNNYDKILADEIEKELSSLKIKSKPGQMNKEKSCTIEELLLDIFLPFYFVLSLIGIEALASLIDKLMKLYFQNDEIQTFYKTAQIQIPGNRNPSFHLILIPKKVGITNKIEKNIVTDNRNVCFYPILLHKEADVADKVENGIVPGNCDASRHPILIPKVGVAYDDIKFLYDEGMSREDIREIFGFDVSRIKDRIINGIIDWQNRPLQAIYLIVWVDGIRFKVMENSKVINKTVYIALGLTKDGKKEVLDLWLGKNESVSFWMSVFTNMKARGVEDILITVNDNLNGFTDAITNVFPLCKTRICAVHQIRNAFRHVACKDKEAFTEDMKRIYDAPTKETATAALEDFAKIWEDKYSYAVKNWKENWQNLAMFFEFPIEIRKIIYTTNFMEDLNSKTGKNTRNELLCPTDQAAIKSVYLTTRELTKKWVLPIRNSEAVLYQFSTIFRKRTQF